MEGLLVLEQFVECWRNHPGFQVDSFGNATFQARVKVQCGDIGHHCMMLVRIRRYGYDDGTVRLRKEASFLAVFPHIDFSSPRDKYKFRGADHALLISGYSDKLDKSYLVSILPAEEENVSG